MDDLPPTINILLLGDPSCGKSTFLSKLSTKSPSPIPPPLRDLDQSFTYNIRLYARPYTFAFSDTSSPTHYTLLSPDFIILCYDISSPASLESVQTFWFKQMVEMYMRERDDVPVMLLGLKRDLRGVEGSGEGSGEVGVEEGGDGGEEGEGFVLPQEGLRVAQEIRVDLYPECSAVTGELMGLVMEDVARTAARTTTEKGGLSEGGCGFM